VATVLLYIAIVMTAVIGSSLLAQLVGRMNAYWGGQLVVLVRDLCVGGIAIAATIKPKMQTDRAKIAD
jgi:hypothetical protein